NPGRNEQTYVLAWSRDGGRTYANSLTTGYTSPTPVSSVHMLGNDAGAQLFWTNAGPALTFETFAEPFNAYDETHGLPYGRGAQHLAVANVGPLGERNAVNGGGTFVTYGNDDAHTALYPTVRGDLYTWPSVTAPGYLRPIDLHGATFGATTV